MTVLTVLSGVGREFGLREREMNSEFDWDLLGVLGSSFGRSFGVSPESERSGREPEGFSSFFGEVQVSPNPALRFRG